LKGEELTEQVLETERAKEEQRNQYESKRRIVAFIFHEVRVPLNTLALGLADIEKEGIFDNLPDDQKDVLSAVNASVEMMENVLNEVYRPFIYIYAFSFWFFLFFKMKIFIIL